MLNIVIPMAGEGRRFKEAGYSFPKPLIDVKGKTMIERVVTNIKPLSDHRFIFICQKKHYDTYDLYNVLRNSTNGHFEVVKLDGITGGAACTILTASKHIDNEDELLIANSDQIVDIDINRFLEAARTSGNEGLIMTFESSHPKWSYARIDKGLVVEVAEKKVISKNATVGIYYFRKGKDFVESASSMIVKNILFNSEFYVCPTYNELILKGKRIGIYPINMADMHGMGTPDDLEDFIKNHA